MNTGNVLEKDSIQIHQNLRSMYQLANTALEKALDSLETQRVDLADAVVNSDMKLNELNRIVERECLQVLEERHPGGGNLREIIASMQVANEIERIGDHAKDIARIVLGMDPDDFSGPMSQLMQMRDVCQNMFTQVMEAFENRDEALAISAAANDEEVDELNVEASSSLLMQLVTQPDPSMHATHLLWIAYHMERVGDRIKNIAERVVFMVTSETPNLDG
jgi:phosphate transport system protein